MTETIPTTDTMKLTTNTFFDELAEEWINELNLQHLDKNTVKGTILLATTGEWKKNIRKAG